MTIVRAGAHLTYPHTNGFHDDGQHLAIARYDPREGTIGISTIPWPAGAANGPAGSALDDSPAVERVVCALPWAGTPHPVWFDVAADANLIVWVRDDALHLRDLTQWTAAVRLYAAPAGAVLDGLCSITADGRRVAVVEHHPPDGSYRLLEICSATGAAQELARLPWHANHVQFSPHTPDWIGFAHEGPARQTPDRIWACHDPSGPEPRCVVDQWRLSEQPGGFVAAGHERWMFHDVGMVFCAYGESDAGPRGIYTAWPDGPAPRLVVLGDRFWHCDISRDGQWIVADTQGPYDGASSTTDVHASSSRGPRSTTGHVSDVVLVDVQSGHTAHLARTWASRHPHHPHPVFSPDGQAVLYNHTDRATGDVSIASVPMPFPPKVA
ncbi:hypothetical protein [Phytoactinopolyspora limicola]|uniref:hypothetical protein n=1 Tax=Phytoactinopolyspora limicola TaxID=2715536 RepID=UPI00140A1663|nr:hypothetical protein [Phytoactinopolyspora limicola]